MIDPKKVSAIIITRGNVPLTNIAKSLECFGELVIWDNSQRPLDFKAFWCIAACMAGNQTVYMQDDDCLVSRPEAIVEAWSPGRIVCNMGAEYRDAYKNKPDKLMGFGSVFQASLIRSTFDHYLRHFTLDEVTLREPNRIFTAINKELVDLVDVSISHMPWASAPDRLWKQPNHSAMRDEAYRRVQIVLAKG